MNEQLCLFEGEFSIETKVEHRESIELLPLEDYDSILVSLSGGKDSVACTLHLLELGVPKEKIELVHQSVDGSEDDIQLFDWPSITSYCNSFSELLGIPISYQWRRGGILGEMLRKDSLTGDVYYMDNGQIFHLPTKNGKESTRLKWPAMSADLRMRWCSAYVKIDVFRRVLNNHPRYTGTLEEPKKILVVTGERREESYNRSKYAEAEIHASNSKRRLVHAWRPCINWSEQEVWDIFERWKLLPAFSYLLGWNRTSCQACVFSNSDLWYMFREISPARFDMLVRLERELNFTIDPSMSLVEKANRGKSRIPKDYRVNKWIEMALSNQITKDDLIMDKWELPAGAFAHGMVAGPM